MNCEDCGYELDDGPILINQHVHKLSRSTRCYNERVWHIYCHINDPKNCACQTRCLKEKHKKQTTQNIELVIAPMPLPVARIHKMPAWLRYYTVL